MRLHLREWKNAVCRMKDCTKRAYRIGLCMKHRKWVQRGHMTMDLQIVKKPLERRIYENATCKIEDCDRKPRRNWLCDRHSAAVHRGNLTPQGEKIVSKVMKYPRDMECIFHACGKQGKITKGFCPKHYSYLAKGYIDYDGVWIRKPKRVQRYTKDDFCRADECNKRPRVRGWCANHFDAFRRGTFNEKGKRLIAKKFKSGGPCAYKDCLLKSYSKGKCRLHYWREKTGYLGPAGYKNVGKSCEAPGCKRLAYCRARCHSHYRRILWKERAGRSPQKALSSPSPGSSSSS